MLKVVPSPQGWPILAEGNALGGDNVDRILRPERAPQNSARNISKSISESDGSTLPWLKKAQISVSARPPIGVPLQGTACSRPRCRGRCPRLLWGSPSGCSSRFTVQRGQIRIRAFRLQVDFIGLFVAFTGLNFSLFLTKVLLPRALALPGMPHELE